jgi:molybdate transport system ATP-binding protein
VLHAEVRTTLGALELDLAFEVEAGRCLALAGPSGAGKTTALRILAGLTRPRAGVVRCGERTWLDTDRGIELPPERRHCGYVVQDYALFGHLRAWQNVAYGLRSERSRTRRRGRALELLERFDLSERADARPAALSGGERQRVALARTLASNPSVLLLDEPLAALDSPGRARARRELAKVLRELDVPVVLVTHDFMEAAMLGDEVAVIDGGHVVQRGSADQLAAGPQSAFVADFSGASVLTGTARRADDGLTRVELDGGGVVTSTAAASGPVVVAVHPWEVSIEPVDTGATGSATNRLAVEVISIVIVGNRARVGLAAPQPLVAEITHASAQRLGLVTGVRVTASWKAAATQILPR